MATLPSIGAAEGWLRGDPGAGFAVLTTVAMRAALIGIGLAVLGERKRLVPYSIAGALAVEAFVLASVRAQAKAGA
jgi:hypothetical protein